MIFLEHPFKVSKDEDMLGLIESIKVNGVLEPIIVRPINGKYEIIAVHRRKMAFIIAKINKISAIIKELNDSDAAIMLPDRIFIEDRYFQVNVHMRIDLSMKH